MDDLGQWLGAQLDEDERIAKAAETRAGAALGTAASKDGVWKPPYDGSEWWNDYDHLFVVCDRPGQPRKVMIADCGHGAFMLTPHLARHDPARVLREIDAKRRLLAIHRPYVPEPDQACLGCAGGIMFTSCPVVRLLALPYADRPGYRAEWRP